MNIGERIKKRRKEIGLSVDDVADKLNKNRATVYRYESNDIEKLPLNILEPLANVLQTTPAYLMGWDTKKNSEITVINNENTSTRLKKIMEEKKLRQVDLLEMVRPFCEKYNVKINKSDISQYLSGKVKPGQEKLSMLGMALNINETWLMGYDVPKEKQFNIENLNLSNEEKTLLKNFNKLDTEDKDKVIDYTILLSSQDKYKEEINKVIELPKKEKQVWEEEGKEHLMPVASHDRDGEFSEEEYKHDDDLMDDEDFWK